LKETPGIAAPLSLAEIPRYGKAEPVLRALEQNEKIRYSVYISLLARGNTMRIYLDNCCYNRPFDDQNQKKIQLETIAKLYIQNAVRNGVYDLVWSFMNDIENNDNPYDDKRESIQKWENRAKYNCKTSVKILQKAKIIEQANVKPKDALNIACAIAGNCDYFISTDRKLISKNIDGITMINPIDFVRKMEDPDDED
jgi:predicted nucleic acid-binding protein